jgi:hypothetical protein
MSNSDHQVQLSINENYTYQYSGGNDGAGNVTNKTKGGPSKIMITIETDGYELVDVHFSGPGQNNFTYQLNGKKKITIDDSCDSDAEVKYTVNAVQTSTGRNVACDPTIKNKT